MTKDATDKEILDHKVDATLTVREISGISFMAWVANKMNGVQAFSAAATELRMAVSSAYYGTMPDTEKVRLFRLLLALEIPV